MGTNSKDKRDIYYRLAKENNFRARSAYKLIHLNEKYNLLNDYTSNVVDLCAAPGSWTQICVKQLYETKQKENNIKVIGVDLLKIEPFNLDFDPKKICKFIEGDITSIETIKEIKELFLNKSADLVLCDGAPDITGILDFDEYYQNQLLLHALDISIKLFNNSNNALNNKTFVCKFFRGRSTFSIYQHLKNFFKFVELSKPLSSRNASIESFFICKELISSDKNPLIIEDTNDNNNNVVELHICGSGNDPDLVSNNPNKTIEHKFPPINPSYKKIIDIRKNNH